MKTILTLLTTFTALSSFAVMPVSVKNEAQRTRLKCENLSIAEYSGLEITEGIQGYMRVFKVYLEKKEDGKRVLVSSGYIEPEKELLSKPFFTGNIAVPNSKIKFNLANYHMLENGKALAYARPEADKYDLIRVGTHLTEEEKIQHPSANDSGNKSFIYDVDCREFN